MGFHKPSGAKDNKKAKIRVRAEELVVKTGIPRNLAFQVAMENISLSEALRKLAFADDVEKLIRRYAFPRSLATQIALGQIALEDVLRKKRMKAYFEENQHRSTLVESAESGARITLMLHGKQRRAGTVLAVDLYEFTFQGKGEPERLHKLQVKAIWNAKKNAAVLSSLKRDPAHETACEPIVKPQDRFHCSNRRLFLHMEARDKLAIHLLEGAVVPGQIDWISKWELGIKLKRGPVVTVFRHAMTALVVG